MILLTPPLLEYYQSIETDSRIRVARLGENWGHKALWECGILEELDIKTPYAYTDSDVLPIEECPDNFVQELLRILRKYPGIKKAGPGLYLDDLPESKNDIVDFEEKFYNAPIADDLYYGPIDTTFAVYRNVRKYTSRNAVRARGRIQVRHLSWYYNSFEDMPEDERYYGRHANSSSTNSKNLSVNILVVGNSISLHGKCEYWYAEYGMAASSRQKDYVHMISREMSKHVPTKCFVVNMANWEIMWYDRNEALHLMDAYFGRKYGLVVIQLGENIQNIDTLEADLIELINYTKRHISTDVPVMIIGNFWINDAVDEIKKKVAAKTNSIYISLQDIQYDAKYKAGMPVSVVDDDGERHQIYHQGVAMHPGDIGMAAIAERILEHIKV